MSTNLKRNRKKTGNVRKKVGCRDERWAGNRKKETKKETK
jgi:hypothetical protein